MKRSTPIDDRPSQPAAPRDLRHRLVRTFITAWLAVQVGVPLVRKFGPPDWPRYRYATFSWAMFSRINQHFEVTAFRREAGTSERQPVPRMDLYARGFNDEGVRVVPAEAYRTREQVKEHFAALARHVAGRRADEAWYGVSIRFRAGPEGPEEVWRYVVRSARPDGGGAP